MKEKFKWKRVQVNNEDWDKLRFLKKYYGRDIPILLNEAIKDYLKQKMKEIDKSNEN